MSQKALSATTKVYIYKMTSDDGGAPCVRGGMLSLAICKPAIRSSAVDGSIVLAFAADSLYLNNCLTYAARDVKRVEGTLYYRNRQYATRPDCIYRWDGGEFKWKPGARFHTARSLTHDLGKPPAYKRAKVLLSHDFRYFRGDCPLDYKRQFPNVKHLVENLGQGHRVNHTDALREELRMLIGEVFKLRSSYTETPAPATTCKRTCNRLDDEFETVDCRVIHSANAVSAGGGAQQ